MGLRTRKLVGSIGIFVWMVLFSLTVMAVMGQFERPHVVVEMLSLRSAGLCVDFASETDFYLDG